MSRQGHSLDIQWKTRHTYKRCDVRHTCQESQDKDIHWTFNERHDLLINVVT